MKRLACMFVVSVAVVGTACSKSTSSGITVPVEANDNACTPATTQLGSGKTTFKVTNIGSKVTELYVYGRGDKVLGEVENIGAQTTRPLSVDLKAGAYELACKPGQTGRGIRAPITVS